MTDDNVDDVFEDQAARLSEDDELRAHFAIAEREAYWKRMGLTIQVNAATGQMISPNGTIPDDVIVEWEQDLRKKLAKPPGGDLA